MSLAERTTSERLIQAMGPMVKDESKIQKVILFIRYMRNAKEELPQMSFEELESCIPLDTAFAKLRDNVQQSYTLK